MLTATAARAAGVTVRQVQIACERRYIHVPIKAGKRVFDPDEVLVLAVARELYERQASAPQGHWKANSLEHCYRLSRRIVEWKYGVVMVIGRKFWSVHQPFHSIAVNVAADAPAPALIVDVDRWRKRIQKEAEA